jgi:hypothetical protein
MGGGLPKACGDAVFGRGGNGRRNEAEGCGVSHCGLDGGFREFTPTPTPPGREGNDKWGPAYPGCRAALRCFRALPQGYHHVIPPGFRFALRGD